MVHGLFMEAMRWDMEKMDSLPGEMNPVRQHCSVCVAMAGY